MIGIAKETPFQPNRKYAMINPKLLINRAIQQSDDLVVVFDYLDAKGQASRRVVSPYRFLGDSHFLGLCLTREDPRQFQISRCRNLKIDLASNYMMPVVFEALTAVA